MGLVDIYEFIICSICVHYIRGLLTLSQYVLLLMLLLKSPDLCSTRSCAFIRKQHHQYLVCQLYTEMNGTLCVATTISPVHEIERFK